MLDEVDVEYGCWSGERVGWGGWGESCGGWALVFQNVDAEIKYDLVPTERDVVHEDDLVIIFVDVVERFVFCTVPPAVALRSATSAVLRPLSACVPCGSQWPIDAVKVLTRFKEKVAVQLLGLVWV